MAETEYDCPVCLEERGKNVRMVQLHDKLECPECGTTLINTSMSPVPRWADEWRRIAETNYPSLRPPFGKMDFPNPFLLDLYQDAYVKEVIYLNEGKAFEAEFGPALEHAKDHGFLRHEDYWRLKDFKNQIRNRYQHARMDEILRDRVVAVWPIDVNRDNLLESLGKATEEIRTGKRKPMYVLASRLGSLGAPIKQRVDQELAVPLFNAVHDFLIEAQVKYLTRERYEGFNRRFGSPIDRAWHPPP